MRFNKSFKFIESVTILTLLKIAFALPLTQRNAKRAPQKHNENSIILKEDMYYDNSEYLSSYGNEIYDTYNSNPIQASYKEKDLFNNNEQYTGNTRRQQQKEEEEKVLVDNAHNIQNNITSPRMEWNNWLVDW